MAHIAQFGGSVILAPVVTQDLQRFVDAQEPLYDQVRRELRAGTKRSHWMWFIFPQLAGLGHSPMAQRYALGGVSHAAAYLAHPVLGARLRECVALVNAHAGRTASEMFGYPDCLKLHSSLTLFHEVDSTEPLLMQALGQLYGGELDQATLKLLQD
jgi:uncharacterized protein (DUF1810 family)